MYKLILIDDEPWVLKGLENIVTWQEYGFEIVAICTDAAEGLEKIRAFMPDVVFTDIRMQGMDGMTLIRTIYEEKLPIQVVILSAYSDFEVAREAISKQVFEYLLKPLDRKEVEMLVVRLSAQLDENKHKGRISLNKGVLSTGDMQKLQKAAIYSHCYFLISRSTDAEEDILKLAAKRPVSVTRVQMNENLNAWLLSVESRENSRMLEELENVGASIRNKNFLEWESMKEEAWYSMVGRFTYSDYPLIASVELYLVQHFNENISLENLAGKFHISKNYLCDMFLKHTGTTMNNFLKRFRIQYAVILLHTTDMSIKDIADKIGYEDSGYFTRVFKQIYDISPELFRKETNSQH